MFKLPNLLYIDNKDNSNYHRGYRHLDSFDAGEKISVLSKYMSNDCVKVWVCFDLGNGDVLNEYGKVYLWIFYSKQEAILKYKEHKRNKKFAQLKFPEAYYIVDKFVR